MSSTSEENSCEEGTGIGELRIQDVRSVPSAASDGEFQIKEEPEDQGYEIAILGNGSVSEQINQQLNNEVWSNVAASLRESEKKKDGRALPLAKTLKEAGRAAASPDMRSIIDGLLLKNEYLLSQNDASCFKPYSRAYKHRNWSSEGAKDPAADKSASYYSDPSSPRQISVPGTSGRASQPGPTTVIMPDPAAPGYREVDGSASSTNTTVESPHPRLILKPRSPTRKCMIPLEDRNHFNLALIESKVLDRPGNKMFRIHKHELVCAISSSTLMINPAKTVVAHFDMKYYWCNFCQFNTANKKMLLTHVVEHRFLCKYCRYQSFSRADVIYHTAETHDKFSNTASVLNFCTLLPDYLQVSSQTSDGSSHHQEEEAKQEQGESDAETGGVKREAEESTDDMPARKLPRRSAEMPITLNDLELEEDFEPVTMVDDNSSSQGISPVSKKLQTLPLSADPLPTVASMLTEVPGSSGESSPQPQTAVTSFPPPSLSVQGKLSCGQIAVGGKDSHLISSKALSSAARKQALQSGTKSREKGTQLGNGLTGQEAAATRPQSSGPSVRRSSSSGQAKEGDQGSSSSSDLIWQCGYCEYNSALQSEIKLHSAQAHAGLPRRVVASIEANGKAAGTSKHFTRKRKVTRDDADDEAMGLSEESNDDSPPVVEGHESDADFTPSSKTPKGKRKSSTQFQCIHCVYSAKRLGVMKNHIFNLHRGLGLIALDLSLQTRQRLVRFCLRDGCRYFTENAAKFKRHVSICTPWNAKNATDVKVEDYMLSCLEKTINFSPLASSPTGKTQGAPAE